jgi:signal transduction histidine kinase/ActR/RegA family two-component response regulator
MYAEKSQRGRSLLRAARASALSVRANLLIAAVVPLTLFFIGAAATLYVSARAQHERDLRAKLDTVGAFLIQTSRFGLLAGSRERLEQDARQALRADPDVVHVSMYGRDGELLVAVGEAVPTLALDRARVASYGHQHGFSSSGYWELRQTVRFPAESSGAESLAFLGDELHSPGMQLGEPEGLIRVVLSAARARAQLRDMLLWSGGVMAAALLLASLLVFGLSRGHLRAIGMLSDAVRQIGAGDLQVKVPDLGSGEVAELGGAFNEMTDQLRRARRELHEYQADLEGKVHLRTRQLEAARIEAERANRAKSEFLANVSHEIRTPMTAILGYSEMLLDGDPLPPAVRAQLEIIRRNGAHLLSLLNDILDISKIEAGRLEVERIPTNLAQVVAEVASLMRVRASEKGLALRASFDTPIPTPVLLDPTRIRQALVNLVGNAIKFTPRGSVAIEVGYDSRTERAQLAVRDTGVGIPQDKLPFLFRAFEQADSSTTRQFGGTGLGLAITRRIAQLMQGDCTVESEVGQGSLFRFEFRAPPAPGAALEEIRAESEIRIREAAATSAMPRLSGRILLAEDGPDNQRLISTILRRAGAEVVVAENGRIAVDHARAQNFDLVLLDMAMPVMDGYSTARVLREMGFEGPIVALTAHALSGERDRCIAAGCSDYLTKPLNRAELLARLATLLEKPPPETGDAEAGDGL